uniref:Uncharacterized protein n=1 Tax=Nelumbo nucifera TaxID=4432 RepID=A0A822XKA7_NELNU|nr:TPA_asm: hypothetical protein HUJ06_021034 [Nelumbo nucifera]
MTFKDHYSTSVLDDYGINKLKTSTSKFTISPKSYAIEATKCQICIKQKVQVEEQ